MTARPTKDQINEAMHRATSVAREHTRDPDRIAAFPRGSTTAKRLRMADGRSARLAWWASGNG
jgi:hypothetical protein